MLVLLVQGRVVQNVDLGNLQVVAAREAVDGEERIVAQVAAGFCINGDVHLEGLRRKVTWVTWNLNAARVRGSVAAHGPQNGTWLDYTYAGAWVSNVTQ